MVGQNLGGAAGRASARSGTAAVYNMFFLGGVGVVFFSARRISALFTIDPLVTPTPSPACAS
jgi:hypothetical protein